MDASPNPFKAERETRAETCEEHGPYESVERIRGRWSGCKECGREAAEAERLAQIEAERESRINTWVHESGLVGRFLNTTFKSFNAETDGQREVLGICQAYAETFDHRVSGNLMLIGPCGTGKTHLLAAILMRVARRDRGAIKIATAREIIRRLRATWSRDVAESEDDVINEFGGVPLLAIDELGASFGSDAELVQLLDIIDLRYRYSLPTLVASNLSVPQLHEAIGDRIFDRLRENAQIVVMSWPSHREARA